VAKTFLFFDAEMAKLRGFFYRNFVPMKRECSIPKLFSAPHLSLNMLQDVKTRHVDDGENKMFFRPHRFACNAFSDTDAVIGR
jgi:hypothetical protein